MRPPLSLYFNQQMLPPSYFHESELQRLLCPTPYGEEAPLVHKLDFGQTQALEKDGKSYRFSLQKSADGKHIVLDARLTDGDKSWQTHLAAKHIKDDLFEITRLVFDNKQERLTSHEEMTNVLAHIGRHMLSVACRDQIPAPHAEKGWLSPVGRFISRNVVEGFRYYPGGF